MNYFQIFGRFTDNNKFEQETIPEIREKYQTLVENLSVGVYRNTSGPKGHFLEANSAMIVMFEARSKEEFMKHDVSDFYQNPEERMEYVDEITKKGEVKNKELNLVTLKGKKFIGSVTAVKKKDDKGNIYFDGVIEDVTEHKRMESELKHYRDTLEAQVKERTHELEDLNSKLNGEIAERKKIQSSTLASNKQLEDIREALLNVMEDLQATKNEIEVAKAKDDAMLASIGDGVIIVNPDAKITFMNRSAQNSLGWKNTEIMGKLLLDVLPVEDEQGEELSEKMRLISRALVADISTQKEKAHTVSPAGAAHGTYYYVRKDKTKFPAAITVAPVIFEKRIVGAIEVFRDITSEKEIDRAKSEFVSLASHQLRTPLGIAKWYLEVLKKDTYMTKSPKITQEYFDEIYKSNERILSLVRDLLSISRIDQGQVKNTPKSVNLITIIKATFAEMKILAESKNVRLNLKLKMRKLPMKYIDPARFQEVIENLLANAIEYSNDSGKVFVEVSTNAESVSIRIKDNGIGISVADQRNLFNKFFRSQKAVATNPEGSGLGLYVVKSYIERWGGTITVTSSEKKGSTFLVTIPITTEKKPNVKKGGDVQ